MSLSKPSVNHEAADRLFRQAIAIAQDASSQLPVIEWEAAIRAIIKGKHLTFRYILVTALLGKATNSCINALALQAGADIEVSDIDIKKNDRIFVAVEVKDKPFGEQDVDHAAFKASGYGLRSITFVVGVNGSCVGLSREQMASAILSKRGVNVIFVDLVPFMASIVALHPELSFVTFFSKLQSCAVSARVKDEVYKHIEQTFQLMASSEGSAL